MKLKIVIKGPKVHDVGYRPFLIALADEFELDGIGVRNAEVGGGQEVRVKVEGDEECIRDFEDAVKARRPEGAGVLSVTSKIYDGRVPSIERTAITNMNLQLAKGIAALGRIDTTLSRVDTTLTRVDTTLTRVDTTLTRVDTTLIGVDKKMDLMLNKQDRMLEKQDETIVILSDMDEKMDRMLIRQDETTEAVKDIKLDDRRLARIEDDIRDIKTKIGAR